MQNKKRSSVCFKRNSKLTQDQLGLKWVGEVHLSVSKKGAFMNISLGNPDLNLNKR